MMKELVTFVRWGVFLFGFFFVVFSSQLALLQCKTEMLLYMVAFFYWLSRMLKSPVYGKGIF